MPGDTASTQPSREAILDALHVECPVHQMRDCSPLLNGCTWWQTIQAQATRVEALLAEEPHDG